MTTFPELAFAIPGPCEPKGRPRISRRGKGFRVHTPTKTLEYERKVASYARLAARDVGGWKVGARVPLRLEVEVVCHRPKRLFRKVDDNGERPPKATRPDLDNYVKSILDGLQLAELFEDDAQVVEIAAKKQIAKILDRENTLQEGAFAWVVLSVVPAL